MELNQEEISQLVYERFTGTISEEDNAFLEHALENNPEYKAIYDQLAAELKAHQLKQLVPEINEEAAWAKVKDQLGKPKDTNARKPNYRVLAYAAAVFLLMGVAFYFYKARYSRHPQELVANPNHIQLQLASGEKVNIDSSAKVIYAGKVKLNASIKQLDFRSATSKSTAFNLLSIPKTLTYSVVLADGTHVMLNSSSRLRFPLNFGPSVREVYLEGEAFFEVAKNPQKPFIVHTPLTDIKVLGTTFNVSAYDPSAVTTSLIEGAVSTTAKNKKGLMLKPGMQAIYTVSQGFSKQTFETDQVVSWMKGVYYFHDTPLQDIAPIIERWFDVKVNFVNINIAALKFSGMIDKSQPLQIFLHNLKATAEINSATKPGFLSLSRP